MFTTINKELYLFNFFLKVVEVGDVIMAINVSDSYHIHLLYHN